MCGLGFDVRPKVTVHTHEVQSFTSARQFAALYNSWEWKAGERSQLASIQTLNSCRNSKGRRMWSNNIIAQGGSI